MNCGHCGRRLELGKDATVVTSAAGRSTVMVALEGVTTGLDLEAARQELPKACGTVLVRARGKLFERETAPGPRKAVRRP